MTYKFEARPYGPESTPEEIEAMRACIYEYQPGILYWRELPVQSLYQIDIFEQRLNQATADWTYYDLIVDMVEAAPPSAEIRQRLRQLIAGQSKLRRAAIFTGKNFLVNIAVKFITGAILGPKNAGLYNTVEEAHEALHQG
jgi:hypothetical protein